MEKEIIVAAIGGIITLAVATVNSKKDIKIAEIENGRETEEESLSNSVHIPDLVDHSIFVDLARMESTVNQFISMDNKGKEMAFKSILRNKLQIWRRHLFEVALLIDDCSEQCSNDCESCNKLYNINMKAFEMAFDEYNGYYKNDHYTDSEKRCLDYIFPHFNKAHKPNIDRTLASIQDTCNNKYLTNCKSKQAIIFYTYTGAFANIIHEVQTVFKDINGHLKGEMFAGREL
jgi:hypothetical protein